MCVMGILPSVKAEQINAQGLNSHYYTLSNPPNICFFLIHISLQLAVDRFLSPANPSLTCATLQVLDHIYVWYLNS